MKVSTSLLFSTLFALQLFAQPGLRAEYFNGTAFNKKIGERTDPRIDLSWNDTPPIAGLDPHDCSIRWTGILTAPQTGTYQFSAKVDDGIRVWVGGVQVIDQWELNDNGQFSGKIKMQAGTSYQLKVEYFNALIEGEVQLRWTLPDTKEPTVVPDSYFTQTIPRKTASQPAKKQGNAPPAKAPVAKPKPKPQTEPAAVLNADTLERYLPKNVQFEQGKSVMLLQSRPSLDQLAGFLLRNPAVQLKIEGHTDIIGDMDMNKTLSEERAAVVADYLVSKGVERGRIEAKGYGSSRPLVTGNSKKGYPENRRVVFVLK